MSPARNTSGQCTRAEGKDARKLTNNYKTTSNDFDTNRRVGNRDNVPIGSKYSKSAHAKEAKVRKHSTVLLDPIAQTPIGPRAAPWRTNSRISFNYNYKVMMERQIAKAQKYCPTE